MIPGEARTGDIYVYDGVEWEVEGFHRQPVVLLRRRDVPVHTALCERTHVALDPTSHWAAEWERKGQRA